MHVRTLWLLALVAASAACSSPTDDISSNAANLTIDPTDFDPLTQAKLTVTIPANIPYNFDPQLVYALTPDSPFGRAVTYGQPFVGRAGAWKLCFSLDGKYHRDMVSGECTDLQTTPGQSLAVALGAVAVRATGAPLPTAAVKPDFGPSALGPRYRDMQYFVDDHQYLMSTNDPPAAKLVFAGAHSVGSVWRSGTKRAITVAPGKVVKIDFTDDVFKRPPEAFHLVVTFEKADLPNLPNEGYSIIGNAWNSAYVWDTSADWVQTQVGLSDSYPAFGSYTFTRPTDSTPIDLVGLVCPGCTAQAELGEIYVPFSMAGGTQTIALKRLDVDHVTVTPADDPSTPYPAYGKWTLTDASGKQIGYAFPTGHGIDLLPGRYHVVISYSTREKQNQTQSFDVTL